MRKIWHYESHWHQAPSMCPIYQVDILYDTMLMCRWWQQGCRVRRIRLGFGMSLREVPWSLDTVVVPIWTILWQVRGLLFLGRGMLLRVSRQRKYRLCQTDSVSLWLYNLCLKCGTCIILFLPEPKVAQFIIKSSWWAKNSHKWKNTIFRN